MANLAEGLASEIARVTELKGQYESLRSLPNVIVGPQIAMMDAAIREGIAATGSGDVIRMMRAYSELQGYEK